MRLDSQAITRKSEQMACELFTSTGERKYLTPDEQKAFIAAARTQERPEVRTFCLVLAFTGCRLSEALELTPRRVDLAAGSLTFRTLKQRREDAFRSIPIPSDLLDTLELVHGIRKALRGRAGQPDAPLWSWGRTQAWKHVKQVMEAAGISGPHATPKGLRHGFGVRMAEKTRQPRAVQKWLGHRSLETTAIYMDVQGKEERDLAMRAWD